MENIFNGFNNVIFKVLILAVFLDTFLGSVRAIKLRKWNSTFGINGVLRKIAIVGSCIFLIIIDSMLSIDMLFFIPKNVVKVFGVSNVGIFDFFGILYILYEVTSIMKNMVLCGMPVPNKIRSFMEKLLNDMTQEIKGGDSNE